MAASIASHSLRRTATSASWEVIEHASSTSLAPIFIRRSRGLVSDQWAVIEPLLPPMRQSGECRDYRQVINGILYVLRTGIPWDDLPARYGLHTTACNRFNRWPSRASGNVFSTS